MLCKCLQIPRSVYYYQNEERINSYKEANNILVSKILKIYKDSKERYGSPKITAMLRKDGEIVSQKRVARRMNILKIKSVVIKKYKPASSSSKEDIKKEYPNLIKQNFKAEKPGEKWLGDITYIWTKESGWTYLAVVIDLFDLKVIGYEHGLNMTDELTEKALKKAVINRPMQKGIIFHSDRGSQYTSNDYEALLIRLGIKHSYSKKGCPYDNASVESFNAILKKEEVNLHTYLTYEEAKLVIFEFIESWYNNIRIHSSLDYLTPNQKYQDYLLALA